MPDFYSQLGENKIADTKAGLTQLFDSLMADESIDIEIKSVIARLKAQADILLREY